MGRQRLVVCRPHYCALVVGWMAVTEIGSRFRLLGKCRPHFWVSFFFIPVALSESLGLVVSQ